MTSINPLMVIPDYFSFMNWTLSPVPACTGNYACILPKLISRTNGVAANLTYCAMRMSLLWHFSKTKDEEKSSMSNLANALSGATDYLKKFTLELKECQAFMSKERAKHFIAEVERMEELVRSIELVVDGRASVQ